MGAVFDAPHQIARTLAVQRSTVGNRGDVFADLLRVVVVVLELDPFRFGGQPQEFVEFGLEFGGSHAGTASDSATLTRTRPVRRSCIRPSFC